MYHRTMMTKILAALLLISTLLAACGSNASPGTSAPPETTALPVISPTDGTEAPPDEVTTAPTAEDTTPVTTEAATATEPEETKPETTEPEKADPKPTDPAPTDPKATDPKETEPAHKHSYTKSTVKPTCTKKGYDLYKCSCGDSYKENYQDAKGHSYTKSTKKPTCTEKGYDLFKCGACGDSYKENYKDATGHKWSDWKTVKEATVSEEGKKERTCEGCGKKETESIPRKEAETIDTKALEAYGRRYAYETYGYDGNPNCNPSTGAGYFPAITKYIYTMEDGYKYARGAVTAQYNNDIGMGYEPCIVIDGKNCRIPLNLYFEKTDTPNKYLIWVYYGGYADPYYD